MPTVIYIDYQGTERPINTEPGISVMEAAIKNAVPGIDAECGGACACATCQVYVDPVWFKKLAPASVMEAAMLDFAENVRPNSRLSCQIKMTDQLDGIRLTTPYAQR